MSDRSTMKALMCRSYGDSSALDFVDLPVPVPRVDEVLVRVRCTTVNRTDTGILSGSPWFARLVFGLRKPKRVITGTEFAGEIVSVGTEVRKHRVGDRVFGFHDEGTSCHAEFVCVSERTAMASIPQGVDYKDAVCCSEGPFYAQNYLRHVPLNAHSRVLINGVSGSIGTAAAQIAQSMHARVSGICLPSAMPILSTLGLEHLYDGSVLDVVAKTRGPYDLILDTVGNVRYRNCKPLVTPAGVFASTELGPYAQNVLYSLIPRRLGGQAVFPIPRELQTCQAKCRELLVSGRYQAIVDRVYPFADIKCAFDYVSQGKKVGNVVVEF